MMWPSKIDLLLIATEDTVLEGEAQAELSQKMKPDWIKSILFPHCLIGMSGRILCLALDDEISKKI